MKEYKFWDIIKLNNRECRYISKQYNEEWETGRHILIDDWENIFNTILNK